MYTTFFPNRDRECFGCSLANYFVLIGEPTLADKIYAEFRKHPFVCPDGQMYGTLATRLVSDLTDYLYNGELLCGSLSPLEEQDLIPLREEQRPLALHAIQEEIAAKRIKPQENSFIYQEKALLIQTGKTIDHWLVDCDNGYIINDGGLEEITNINTFLSTIHAVLLIRRN